MPTPHFDVLRRWVLPLAACGFALAAPTRARADNAAPTVTPVGSLQRTAAAIDDSVDVYRLALVELVPALKLVHERGTQPLAQPEAPLPPVAHEAFSRLAASVQRRISPDALAALPRAYHIEIVDALEALASATRIDAVRVPARALTRALNQQAQLAADVVDVFSRERPIVAEVLGPENALDTINDALGQLGLAEANITTIRDRKGSPGEQLQAFLRLEIALGRALDLIAAAEESGVHLGFEMPRSTVGLAGHLKQMQMRLVALDVVVQAMEHPPLAQGSDVRAEVHPGANPNVKAEVELAWTPPETGAHAPALLRLYTGRDPNTRRRQTLLAGLCAGLSPEAAGKTADDVLLAEAAQDANAPKGRQTPPVEMASGRSGIKLPWTQSEAEATQYRLAAVSAFGVEHAGPWVQPLDVPTAIAAPQLVSATQSLTPYDSELFYHAAGTVTVGWQASQSDVAASPRAKALAKTYKLPVVVRYVVFRTTQGKSEAVADVPPGVTRFVDRPPLAALTQGVRYTVVAMDAHGASARAPEACGQSPLVVEADIERQLRLAAAGAAHVAHPTAFERRAAQALSAPKALPPARAHFAALAATEQTRLWHDYWLGTPMGERVRWHETWVARMSLQQKQALWDKLQGPVGSRDYGMVYAGLWATQNGDYASEPERFFNLLTQDEQRLATQAWRRAMGPDVAPIYDAAQAGQDQDLKKAWSTPIMQGIWFASRDPEEQMRLVQSIERLAPEARASLGHRYVAQLPEALRRAVAWPAWESLTADERDAFLVRPPDITLGPDAIPEGLWPAFLAWVAYDKLAEDEKVAAITSEVGPVGHALSRARYALRPLDVRLGFKMWLYGGLIMLGFVNGVLLRLFSRSLGPKP